MSSEQNVTQWFPAHMKPERDGVYQRSYPDGEIYYARWDGKYWRTFWPTPKLAARRSNAISGFQALNWRGLAEKPQ